MTARIGLILCSADFAHEATAAAELLEKFGIELIATVGNALLRPDPLAKWMHESSAAGMQVLILVDDGRANLPAFAAAHAVIPTLLVPSGTTHHAPPPFVPGVAVVQSVSDAVMFAAEIMAVARPHVAQKLAEYRARQSQDVDVENNRLQSEMKQTRTVPAEAKISQQPEPRISEKDEAWLRQAEADFRPKLGEKKTGAASTEPRQPRIDFSLQLREVITGAHEIARAYRHESVAPVHFIAAMLDAPNSAARAVLERVNADFEKIAQQLASVFPPALDEAPTYFAMDATAREMLQHAKQIARDMNRRCLTTLDILEAVVTGDHSPAGQALLNSGILVADIHAAIRDHREPNECALLEQCQARPREPEKPIEVDQGELARMQQRLSAAPHAQRQPAPPIDATSADESAEEEAIPQKIRIMKCDAENPSVDQIEEAADTLLEGKILGFPTETGYVFGVDATNARAVARLRELTGRANDKPIAILINSTTVLKNLVKTPTEELEDLFDRFWPGPLTIVFEKHHERLKAVSGDNTIAVRIPDHYAVLGMLSMVGRPVAAVPFPGSQHGEKDTMSRIEQFAGAAASLLLDCGPIPAQKKTTVLSAATSPWTVLRPGAIPPEQLTQFVK